MTAARILVVDDNPVNLRLMTHVLRGAGHEVRTAASGQEALDAVAAAPVDLILLDLQMPGMDGYEVARRLDADPATRDVPVIALTAAAMAGDEARARAAGCDDHITKPIDIDLVRAVIARHLAGAHRPAR